jgi:hypothetical protein
MTAVPTDPNASITPIIGSPSCAAWSSKKQLAVMLPHIEIKAMIRARIGIGTEPSKY